MKTIVWLTALFLVFTVSACASAIPATSPAQPTPARSPTTAPTSAPAPTIAAAATSAPAPAAASDPTIEAAQPAAASALPEIQIDAADFAYAAPEVVPAGWVRIRMTNSGQEPHHAQFLRLNDGVTVEQFEDALKVAEGPALGMTQQVGGVGAVHAGGAASAVLNLPAGQYVILCFIPSPGDQTAHHEKGMIKALTVKADSTAAVAPRSDVTVRMKDFGYDLPATLPSGALTFEVINDGPEPHELNMLRLNDGKTLNDVMKFLMGEAGGPPPFSPVGGMNGLDTGLTGLAELDLEPGDYVAICNIPSPQNEGRPHFALGMAWPFSVAATTTAFPTGRFALSDTPSRALTFGPDGTFAAFDGDSRLASGKYSIKEGVYKEESNDADCEPGRRYRFAFDGANLRFYPIEDPATDPCFGRQYDFNPARTWVIVK